MCQKMSDLDKSVFEISYEEEEERKRKANQTNLNSTYITYKNNTASFTINPNISMINPEEKKSREDSCDSGKFEQS